MKFIIGLYRIACLFIAFFLCLNANAQSDNKEVVQLLVRWNDAHNTKDFKSFSKIYAKKVIFYSQELDGDQCVLKKKTLLRASPDFHQELHGEVIVKQYDSGIVKCEFIKEVVINADVKRYPSYLLMRNISGDLYIYGESDEITDKNLRYLLNIGNVVTTQKINELYETSDGSTLQLALFGTGVLLFSGIIIYRWVNRKRKSVNNLEQNEQLQEEESEKVEHKKSLNEDAVVNTPNYAPAEEIDYAQKGLEFEKFVVSKFDKNYFTLINWRGDKGSNGIYAQSNGYPDLEYKFKYHFFERQFAVECKYRQSSTLRDTITIAKDYQIEKYKRFQSKEKMDVYVVVGLGGEPAKPLDMYLIPLKEITASEMHEVELLPFKKTTTSRFFYNSDLDRLT